MGFAKRLKYRLSDLIKLEKPDALSSRYGKAFEKAVLALIKAKDSVAALRTFIENYGEPHTGAFSRARASRVFPTRRRHYNSSSRFHCEIFRWEE